MSWSILDYDQDESKGYDGFYNLSHQTRMDRTADLLPNFELMPVEDFLKDLPLADYLACPSTVQAPKTIKFINKSKGNIQTYYWDFGDGTTSNEINPLHTYSTAGTFTVKLITKGPGGENTKIKVNYVRTF